MIVRNLLFRSVFLTALAFPSSAWAQKASENGDSASNQAAAQALFDEGMRLLADGSYSESCIKFEASLGLVSAMGTRGKLAECYEKEGRTASAWAAYREVAVLALRASQHERARVAKQRAARLEARLAYLEIVVSDTAKIPGLRIERNGVLLGVGAYGTAIATDPGELTLHIQAEGYQSQTLQVALGEEERRRFSIPVLSRLATPAIPMPVVSTIPRAREQVPSPLWRKVALSSAAAGGGALLVASVLGIKSKRDYDEAFDQGYCDGGNRCTEAGLGVVRDARSLANVGTAFAVSGAALIAAGSYLWLRTPKIDRERSLVAMPTIGHKRASLTLGGRF